MIHKVNTAATTRVQYPICVLKHNMLFFCVKFIQKHCSCCLVEM